MSTAILEEVSESVESVESVALHSTAAPSTMPDDEALQAEIALRWLPELSRGGLTATLLLSAVFLAASFRPLGGAETWARLVVGRGLSHKGEIQAAFTSLAGARAWTEYNVWQLAGPQGLLFTKALTAALAALLVAAALRWLSRPTRFVEPQHEALAPLPPRRTLLAMAVVLATLVWSPATHGLLTGAAPCEVDCLSAQTPYFLADTMTRRAIVGRCLAPAEWADFLVFQTAGAIQPLATVANRRDESALDQDCEAVFRAEEGWLAKLDAHNVRWLALDHARHGRLYAAAVDQPRCRTRYLDQQAALIEILPPQARPTDAAAPTSLNGAAFKALNDVQTAEQLPQRRLSAPRRAVARNSNREQALHGGHQEISTLARGVHRTMACLCLRMPDMGRNTASPT